MCFVAFQPFVQENNSPFKNFILSGSYAFGEQQGPVDPADLGTAVPANGPPANLLISPTFLRFSPTAVVQAGFHQVWAAEVIWAVRSFNLYAEYTAGQQRYAHATAPLATFPVSLSGYSVATTYFFTGEEITPERKRVKPLRPFNPRCGGPGAVEGFFRFSNLVLGSNVFTDKLADPAAFANRVNATDVGVNWYLNEYVKVVFDWQHAMFNQPVSYTGVAGGNASRNEDLFWFRFQLYY
jgi:phosphate-selective porin OprO/OprP